MIVKNAKIFQDFYRPLKSGANGSILIRLRLPHPLRGFAMTNEKGSVHRNRPCIVVIDQSATKNTSMPVVSPSATM